MAFQAVLRQLFFGLGNEMKLTLTEEVEKEATGIDWAEGHHVVGQGDERQAVGFRSANQAGLYSLGVQD